MSAAGGKAVVARFTAGRTATADGVYVSGTTGMCASCESDALFEVVRTMRGGGSLADVEQEIANHREVCVEGCGTLAEVGA